MDVEKLFDEQLEVIKSNNDLKKRGILPYIPFHDDYRNLRNIISGLIKGESYLITAPTGCGKSKLTRDLFLRHPIEYALDNKDCDLKIVYLSCEESRSEIINGFILDRLKEQFGITLKSSELTGYSTEIHSDDTLEKIAECKAYFKEMGKYLDVIDITNVFGIYKYMREIMRKEGTFYNKDDKPIMSLKNVPEGQTVNWRNTKWVRYKPDNPHKTYMLVVDRLWLLSKDKDKTKYETITHFMEYYCRSKMNIKMNIISVCVQMQTSETDKIQKDNRGRTMEKLLEPSLSNLARVKATVESATVCLGLFAPNKYGIEQYKGYDITKLGDGCRFLFVLKNRSGLSQKVCAFFFDGAKGKFRFLPPPKDTTALRKVYNRIAKLQSI